MLSDNLEFTFQVPEYPSHILVFEHSLLDTIVIDDDSKHIIGQPWLTRAVDFSSLIIWGIHVSLKYPSSEELRSGILYRSARKQGFGIINIGKDGPEVMTDNITEEVTKVLEAKFRVGRDTTFKGTFERLFQNLNADIKCVLGDNTLSGDYRSNLRNFITLKDFKDFLNLLHSSKKYEISIKGENQ